MIQVLFEVCKVILNRLSSVIWATSILSEHLWCFYNLLNASGKISLHYSLLTGRQVFLSGCRFVVALVGILFDTRALRGVIILFLCQLVSFSHKTRRFPTMGTIVKSSCWTRGLHGNVASTHLSKRHPILWGVLYAVWLSLMQCSRTVTKDVRRVLRRPRWTIAWYLQKTHLVSSSMPFWLNLEPVPVSSVVKYHWCRSLDDLKTVKDLKFMHTGI